MMCNVIQSLVQWSEKRKILYRLGWVVTNCIRAIVQPEVGRACTSPCGSLASTHWDAKSRVIP
jgi:hypothetical protein